MERKAAKRLAVRSPSLYVKDSRDAKSQNQQPGGRQDKHYSIATTIGSVGWPDCQLS